MYYCCLYDSPLGELCLLSDETHLIGLWIKDQKYYLSSYQEETFLWEETAILKQTKDWLDRYFKKEQPDPFELSLKPEGTLFQQMVWKHLCKIPYGHVTTYKMIANQVAEEMGKASMSAQAVGSAVGHNPISIIIPCHRVVGTNGNLTGYAGGLDNKRKLLDLETDIQN